MSRSFTASLVRGLFFFCALTVFSALPPTNPIAEFLGQQGSPPAAAAEPYCTSDADANGASDARTDGLLIIRHLFGFSGPTLTDDALAADATRTDPAEIAAYLDTNGDAFDVDGNTVTDALTDGLLIIRRLFGFSGATLTDGAVAPDATLTDPADIGASIDALGTCSQINDTGIDWGGDYPDGNNATTCTSNIAAPQDCDYGRDATYHDDSDGHAGFSFTKLDAAGNELPASATEWSCVLDNVTGLTWEVKSDDGGIHDKDNLYRWGGKTALGDGTWGTYYDDWDSLVDGSNNEGLCGFTDWRVPTIKELEGLVDASRYNPSIDSGYFPNTRASDFWSSLPYAGDSYYAWGAKFSTGSSHSLYRTFGYLVRLVRSRQ